MGGTLVLDCEGLSKLYLEDRLVTTYVEAAREEDVRVVTTAMTTLEADWDRVHPARVRWVHSRLDVHEVTKAVAAKAAELLREHRLAGHQHAIDAVVAAVAQAAPRPVTVLTSDPDDLRRLCGPGIRVVEV